MPLLHSTWQSQRDLLIYVSRQAETSRRVGNEEELLTAIRAAFPDQPLAVFNGDLSTADTIQLFQRARMVLGPHGAGLSHTLFAAPGTTVLEFLFLSDPPLMFWHTAAALGQPYWLLPVPQAYWMQEEMQVPVGEVISILTAALTSDVGGQASNKFACQPGSYAIRDAGGVGPVCILCSPGSYAFNARSTACQACPAGRYAAAPGATACRTCLPGTYSAADGTACLDCPAGTFSVLPGAWSEGQCLTSEQRRKQQEDQSLSVQMLSKLSPVFAEQRRRLIEQGVTSPGTASLAELCAAQKALAGGGFGDPYRGPYLMAGMTGGNSSALLANCSALENTQVVLAPPPMPELVASPPAELPPVDVPTLPPAMPLPPMEPRTTTQMVDQAPPPAPEPSVYPQKKKVVDNYVIILACVLGGLLVLPLLAWLARRAYLARQHRKTRAGVSAATAPLAGAASSRHAFNNPAYQMDADDAASTSSGAGSATKLGRSSPL